MHHIDPELLHAALVGEVPVKTVMRQLLAHMTEMCPDCAATVRELRRAVARGEIEVDPLPATETRPATQAGGRADGRPDPRYVGAFESIQEEAGAWAIRLRRERRRAGEDVAELLRLPPESRAGRIERARSRYRSRAVADLLLVESRRLIDERPAESRNLAGLVDLVLLWTPGAFGQDWARELSVRAAAWVANAYVMEHDLRAAERAFADVRVRMARELVGEAVHAAVASLEASLRIEQSRFDEARRLLDRAAAFYRAAGRWTLLARVLSKRAVLEDALGDSMAAAAAHRQAIAVLQDDGDSELLRASILGLAFVLLGDDRAREAEAVLQDHARALTDVWQSPAIQVLRGRISFAEGRDVEAEELFLAARAESMRSGDAVNAAVASLDLALLYLARGQFVEVRRMARLMGSIVDSVGLDSRVLGVVTRFRRAVEQGTVTEEAIRACRRQLEVGRPGSLPLQRRGRSAGSRTATDRPGEDAA